MESLPGSVATPSRASGGSGLREATRADHASLAACLARAFEDDPVTTFLFPGARTRRRRLEAFYRLVLPMLCEHGLVQTDAERRGAAVWRAPSPPPAGPLRAMADAARMFAFLRGSSSRALKLERVVQRSHPRQPHWYLAILGTEPALQGRGIGSSLLGPVLARCDGQGVLAYLESSKAENVPFYERHGFRVICELHVPEGPRLWSMLREPTRACPALNRDAVSADQPGR